MRYAAVAIVALSSAPSALAFAPAVRSHPSGLAQRAALPRKPTVVRAAAPPQMAVAAVVRAPLQLAAAIAAPLSRPATTFAVVAAVVLAAFAFVMKRLNTPSRIYDREANTVGREYDAWTSEGVLEYYWGEHIHLGWYEEGQRKGPFYGGKDFIEAKYDFTEKMLQFSQIESPATVLDVGCGIGGSSRYIAKRYPEAQVTGITLSPEQQSRATALAAERGIPNAKFEVVDALNMKFPDDSFDLVWACESGEHMPDKEKYIQEMARVLKPGGRMVVATWCQRETPPEFNAEERKTLDYLYGEWTHPYFISIEEYERIMQRTGKLDMIVTDDWAKETIPAWRQSIWVGVWDPWPVVRRPHLWWKVARDAWCLEVMHRAFTNGLMEYGMFTAQKPLPAGTSA